MSSFTRSQRVHTGVEGAALQFFLSTIKGVDEEGDKESMSVCDGGGPMTLQMKVKLKLIAEEMPPEPKNRQQTMNLPE